MKKNTTGSINLWSASAYLIACISLMGILFTSCKKEFVDKYNIVPGDTVNLVIDNQIEAFSIKEFSADTTIKASIVADTIFVYWPTYKHLPATIKPEIELAEKAKITPQSGAEVAFVTGTKYVVTSETGVAKNYVLKVVPKQPTPYFSLFVPYTWYYGQRVNGVGGDFWLTDTSKTKVFFVDSETKMEYPAETLPFTNGSPSFFVGDGIPAGKTYDLKIVNGIHSVYSTIGGRNTIEIAAFESPFIIATGYPFTLNAGESITLRGGTLNLITEVYIQEGAETDRIKLEIEKVTETRLKVKIPQNTPKGTYNITKAYTASGSVATRNGVIVIN